MNPGELAVGVLSWIGDGISGAAEAICSLIRGS